MTSTEKLLSPSIPIALRIYATSFSSLITLEHVNVKGYKLVESSCASHVNAEQLIKFADFMFSVFTFNFK